MLRELTKKSHLQSTVECHRNYKIKMLCYYQVILNVVELYKIVVIIFESISEINSDTCFQDLSSESSKN